MNSIVTLDPIQPLKTFLSVHENQNVIKKNKLNNESHFDTINVNERLVSEANIRQRRMLPTHILHRHKNYI